MTKYKTGPFRMIFNCSACEYYAMPNEFHDECCPKCGEINGFNKSPGRYIFTEKKFLGILWKTNKIVGFSTNETN